MPANDHQNDDRNLLRAFAERRDEGAFRALVERYAGLVFGVAKRRTGREGSAEEVAQNVFLVLAAKAGTLGGVGSLGAWLHRVATLESLKYLRTDATRQRHLAMIRDHQEIEAAGSTAGWRDIRPHLDALLDRLPARDREILLLHYFEGLSFAEIATRTGLGAAAAQKRGARALEKLARLLGNRGVVATATALGVGLGAELAPAAPVGFARGVATAVLQSTAAAGTAGATFTTTLTAMLSTKAAFATAFVLAAAIPVAREMTRPAPAPPRTAVLGSSTAGMESGSTQGAAAQPQRRFDAESFRAALRRLQGQRNPDGAEVHRLRRLMFTLRDTEIARALAVLEEFDKPDPLRDIVAAAYAHWAEIDPASAVAAAGASPVSRWGYYPLNGAWQTWAFSDWEAARAWARDTETAYDHTFLFWGVLDRQGELDGLEAVARAGQLAADYPEKGDVFLRRALAAWARHEPDAAIAWMDENVTEPVRRDQIIGETLESLGDVDPAAALDRVALLENAERLKEVRYNIFWQWVLNQPVAATAYLQLSGAGETWDANTLFHAGEGLARNDPALALTLASGIVDPIRRDQFHCGILCGAAKRDPLAVREAADAIGEESARTNNSLGDFLDAWSAIDRAAAAAWVDALPEGGKKEWARHTLPK